MESTFDAHTQRDPAVPAVTQGVFIAAGLQKDFCFKDVAVGAASQLASFGLDSLVEAGKLGSVV
jgi:hypothetical protein